MPMTIPSETAKDLTASQSTQSLAMESIDLEIPETNENLVTSTPYENVGKTNENSKEESMAKILITETPVENERKRKLNKVTDVDLNESDDDLFQFQSKKTCNENKAIDKASPVGKEISKNNAYSDFLHKTQGDNKTQKDIKQSEAEASTSGKENRKRPLIQVLNEDDEGDDDLFSFGDTQKTKKVRKQSIGEEEDLFSFNDKETNKSNKPLRTIDVDEDSNDMEPTQQFILLEKVNKKTKIEMPKPKVLPSKVSALEWISSSLGKMKIKKENSTTDTDTIKTEGDIKTETADELVETDDHRKWLESLKNAIEIQQVSIKVSVKCGEKSHYKFKNQSNNTSENLNGTTSNFKKFVKVRNNIYN